MKTIAFYAYKGGTGRTLLLANTAKFLSSNNKKVFLIDLDFEAPGLGRKFNVDVKEGFVDYLYEFLDSKNDDVVDFKKHVIKIDENIDLLPAGNPFVETYSERLAQINWHNLFYKKIEKKKEISFDFRFRKNKDCGESVGDLIFRNIVKEINNVYRPDYLLVDSRTGITDIGGMALHQLADEVVCLFLNNNENFAGIGRVIGKLKKENKKVYPIVTRFPYKVKNEIELIKKQDIIKELIKKSELSDEEEIDLSVFHSDVGLEYYEEIKYANKKILKQSVLLRDYINIFNKIYKDVVSNSIYKDYLNIINKKDKYPELEEYVSDRPYDFEEVSVKRIEKLNKIGFRLKTINPGYFDNEYIASFIQSVVNNVGEQVNMRENLITNNINWNLLGFQFDEGVFDFCKDLYFLNETRANLVDIYQIGCLKTFEILFLDENLFGLIEDNDFYNLEDALKSQNNSDKYIYGVIGDQAASSEVYKVFSRFDSRDEYKSVKINYEDVVIKRNESELAEWIINKDTNKKCIIIDHVTSKIVRSNIVESNCQYQIKSIKIKYENNIPVGFMYKKNCPNIRYEINLAVSRYLKGIAGEDRWRNIERILKDTYQVSPFSWDQIKSHIMWDLMLEDAVKWS